MAAAVYGDRDPSERFVPASPQRIQKEGADSVLSLDVPFLDRNDVDLSRHNGELFVTVGNYRREITLPRVLAQRETTSATIDDGKLRVRFAKRQDVKKK